MSDLLLFRETLRCAAAGIDAPYFQLPVAGQENPEYRERVYAYELYHQLRQVWPEKLAHYSLGGEVDKAGHPLIRGNNLDNAKPDLIVHVPSGMDSNLAVVEIKPAPRAREGAAQDLRKLAAFCDPSVGKYAGGFFLVYGLSSDDALAFREHCESQLRQSDLHGKPLYLLAHSAAATIPDAYELWSQTV
ncbi:hypothetical protein [Gemmatimonas sp.]